MFKDLIYLYDLQMSKPQNPLFPAVTFVEIYRTGGLYIVVFLFLMWP